MVKNDYYSYRRKIKSGDLLVWNKGAGNLLDTVSLFLIKLFTLSEYVHVGIAWRVAGRLFVIEATMGGVRITPLSKRAEFFHLPMGIKWLKSYDSFLLDKVGNSYSIMSVIKGYLGLYVNTKDAKWQCVELANSFYKYTGIDFNDIFTPAKLVTAILKDGGNIFYVSGKRVNKTKGVSDG